jgi:AcrR family transcriptional regulator
VSSVTAKTLLTRRERERDSLRQRILQGAIDVAHTEGWASVSMRRIAEKVDYTAPALYHHFASKDAVIVALRQRGYQLLLERFQRIRSTDPIARLTAMARHHVEFAFAHPELFNAMYGHGGVSCESKEAPVEAQLIAATVHESARKLFSDEGASARFDDEIDAVWASMHGIVALALTGHVEGGASRAKALSQIILDNTITAWTTQRHITTEEGTQG